MMAPGVGLFLCMAFLLSNGALAQTVYPLWPQGAPGAQGTNDRDIPRLTAWMPSPQQANGGALIICPGGGYAGLAINHEGHDVARWFAENGVAGFVLEYRYGHYAHPYPSMDGARAVRYVRAHAREFDIDPDRVGMMGFSAGGHVASTVGTHFSAGDAAALDTIEHFSSRPDFLVLIYPVITMKDPYTHVGSRSILLSNDLDPVLIEDLSNECQVDFDTPPAFLSHGPSDPIVSYENSRMFHDSLVEKGVGALLYTDPTGGHGYGMAGTWTDTCLAWLAENGFMAGNTIIDAAVSVRSQSSVRRQCRGCYAVADLLGRRCPAAGTDAASVILSRARATIVVSPGTGVGTAGKPRGAF